MTWMKLDNFPEDLLQELKDIWFENNWTEVKEASKNEAGITKQNLSRPKSHSSRGRPRMHSELNTMSRNLLHQVKSDLGGANVNKICWGQEAKPNETNGAMANKI